MNLLQVYEVVDSHFLVVKESNGMTALVIDTTSDKSVARLFNKYNELTKVLNISYNESWGGIELVIGEEE
ncbi:hypothetical protein [Enterococcus phage FX417]|uniref:Uncharacterized protein n=1 Tax=Enterococcus phage FX417 TaxID=2769573 RepID=A0A7S6IL71_9CAUD|nr:hypothetical protein [Enterococcus phage FX417]